jgi:hypothetical protein
VFEPSCVALSAQVGLQQQRRIVVTHAAAQAVKADTAEEFIEVCLIPVMVLCARARGN